MELFTPNGKIKTIRCIKSTHEDFAELVRMGKRVLNEIRDKEENIGCSVLELEEKIKMGLANEPVIENSIETILEAYTYFMKKTAELEGYRNVYHQLMEGGVDELLQSIHIGPESYQYDFFQLCLEYH